MKPYGLLLWAILGFSLFSPGLGQSETIFYLRAGHDLGCQGWGGDLGLRNGAFSYGAEYYACQGASRTSFRLSWQPLPIFPLEVGAYGGVLGGLPSWGFLVGSWLPMASTDEGWRLVLHAAAGLGWTHLPIGQLLPGIRLVLSWEARFPVTLNPPTNRAMGEIGVGDTSDTACVPPTPETLMAFFNALVESTRSAVISSLSALYTDFQYQLSDLEVLVEGNRGSIRGRYAVEATHRLTRVRHSYSGQGAAEFRHNGCSWELVSYRY